MMGTALRAVMGKAGGGGDGFIIKEMRASGGGEGSVVPFSASVDPGDLILVAVSRASNLALVPRVGVIDDTASPTVITQDEYQPGAYRMVGYRICDGSESGVQFSGVGASNLYLIKQRTVYSSATHSKPYNNEPVTFAANEDANGERDVMVLCALKSDTSNNLIPSHNSDDDFSYLLLASSGRSRQYDLVKENCVSGDSLTLIDTNEVKRNWQASCVFVYLSKS